jgi:hypothetical protein
MSDIELYRAAVNPGLRCPKCGCALSSGGFMQAGEDGGILRLECDSCRESAVEIEVRTETDIDDDEG